MIPAEIFLSHASPDSHLADRLARVLRRHGLRVWYSPSEIVGARQWHDEIGAALRRCDWFAVVLTSASVESMWVRRELHYALRQDRYHDHIVPIVAEPCDAERLSWVLSGIQSVDLQSGFDHGCRQLLRIWGVDYRP